MDLSRPSNRSDYYIGMSLPSRQSEYNPSYVVSSETILGEYDINNSHRHQQTLSPSKRRKRFKEVTYGQHRDAQDHFVYDIKEENESPSMDEEDDVSFGEGDDDIDDNDSDYSQIQQLQEQLHLQQKQLILQSQQLKNLQTQLKKTDNPNVFDNNNININTNLTANSNYSQTPLTPYEFDNNNHIHNRNSNNNKSQPHKPYQNAPHSDSDDHHEHDMSIPILAFEADHPTQTQTQQPIQSNNAQSQSTRIGRGGSNSNHNSNGSNNTNHNNNNTVSKRKNLSNTRSPTGNRLVSPRTKNPFSRNNSCASSPRRVNIVRDSNKSSNSSSNSVKENVINGKFAMHQQLLRNREQTSVNAYYHNPPVRDVYAGNMHSKKKSLDENNNNSHSSHSNSRRDQLRHAQSGNSNGSSRQSNKSSNKSRKKSVKSHKSHKSAHSQVSKASSFELVETPPTSRSSKSSSHGHGSHMDELRLTPKQTPTYIETKVMVSGKKSSNKSSNHSNKSLHGTHSNQSNGGNKTNLNSKAAKHMKHASSPMSPMMKVLDTPLDNPRSPASPASPSASYSHRSYSHATNGQHKNLGDIALPSTYSANASVNPSVLDENASSVVNATSLLALEAQDIGAFTMANVEEHNKKHHPSIINHHTHHHVHHHVHSQLSHLSGMSTDSSKISKMFHPGNRLNFSKFQNKSGNQNKSAIGLNPESQYSTAAALDPLDELDNMEVLNHYDKHRELGNGTDAFVYEVVDRRDKSHVAMKLTKRKSGRYKTEIHLLHQLRNCPYVVQLLNCLENDNVYVLILEHAPMSLENLLLQRCTKHPMQERVAKTILQQIFRGILAIHNLGFVHKDIKPENILIFANRSERKLIAKVADFGFATRVAPEKFIISNLPREKYLEFEKHVGDRCGTPGFWPPELVAQIVELKCAFKMDVFSAGVTLYRMLCNEMPFGIFETWKYTLDHHDGQKKLCKVKPNWKVISWIQNEQKYTPVLSSRKLTENVKALLRMMLRIRPLQRATVDQCLSHEFFKKTNKNAKKSKSKKTRHSSSKSKNNNSKAKG